MATITDLLQLSALPAAHAAPLRQLGRAMGDKLDVDAASAEVAGTSCGSCNRSYEVACGVVKEIEE